MGEVARVYPLNRQQPEPLWREVLGGRLRALRAERKETLAETAERAGISPQYLSEVERGRKEPSSEMIAALAGALDTTLADLTTEVTEDLRHSRSARSDRGARASRASSILDASSAPSAPDAPDAPGAPGAPVVLALAA
jgi:transcriptional regulator with XRE-family HTH domain